MGVDALRRTSARFKGGHERYQKPRHTRRNLPCTLMSKRQNRRIIRPVTRISPKTEIGLQSPSNLQRPLRVLDRTIDSHIKQSPSDLREAPEPRTREPSWNMLDFGVND